MFLIQSIYIAPLVAIYVLTCLVAKLYCVACSGESKWYIWVPFGVREVTVCEASEKYAPHRVTLDILMDNMCSTVGLFRYWNMYGYFPSLQL